MEIAQIFSTGESQAVRLPKICRFTDDEVCINRIGNIVILLIRCGRSPPSTIHFSLLPIT